VSEIRRIVVQSQPKRIVLKPLFQKDLTHFNKIRDKSRTGSASKQGEVGGGRGQEVGWRNDPNDVCTCE
jgi:hypothetical protein